MRVVGGSTSLPAVLFRDQCVSPHDQLGSQAPIPSTVGTHRHTNPCTAYTLIPSLQAPQPCPPRMQVGPGCWRRAQHRVNYLLLHNAGAQRVSSLLLPWISPLPPRPVPAPPAQLTGVPGSILAHETSCFPVRHSCFYLTPFQLPKLARTGSCSVCLGRRCVATNYF